jgi:hypothetical protein
LTQDASKSDGDDDVDGFLDGLLQQAAAQKASSGTSSKSSAGPAAAPAAAVSSRPSTPGTAAAAGRTGKQQQQQKGKSKPAWALGEQQQAEAAAAAAAAAEAAAAADEAAEDRELLQFAEGLSWEQVVGQMDDAELAAAFQVRHQAFTQRLFSLCHVVQQCLYDMSYNWVGIAAVSCCHAGVAVTRWQSNLRGWGVGSLLRG